MVGEKDSGLAGCERRSCLRWSASRPGLVVSVGRDWLSRPVDGRGNSVTAPSTGAREAAEKLGRMPSAVIWDAVPTLVEARRETTTSVVAKAMTARWGAFHTAPSHGDPQRPGWRSRH